MTGKLIAGFLIIIMSVAEHAFAAVPNYAGLGKAKSLPVESIRSIQPELMLHWLSYANQAGSYSSKPKAHELDYLQKLSNHFTREKQKSSLNQYDSCENSSGLKVSLLLKGLLLCPMALLLAYFFVGDDKPGLIKWVWFGLAGWVLWVGIALACIIH